jgi:CheY-like chemotaxis protein
MTEQRILLVDDDPVALDGFGGLLREAGYEVVTCPDGPQAVEFVLQQRPDLVILDLGLPSPDPDRLVNFDGFRVLNWIARMHTRTPVIVLTIQEGADVEAQALAAGALALVNKREKPYKLLQAVQIALAA